jgi:hypothetical protein
VDDNTGGRLKSQIVNSQAYQLGDAQSACETEMKHGTIPDADSTGWIRRI